MFYAIHYSLTNMATVKAKLPAHTKILEQNKDRGWCVIQSPVEWDVLIRLFRDTDITVAIDHTHDKKKVA